MCVYIYIGDYDDFFEYFGWHLKGEHQCFKNGIMWHHDLSEKRMRNIFRKNCQIEFGDLKSGVKKGDIVRMRVDSNGDQKSNISFFLNGQINNIFFDPKMTLFFAVGCYFGSRLSVTIIDE